jgi:hypothetical protein
MQQHASCESTRFIQNTETDQSHAEHFQSIATSALKAYHDRKATSTIGRHEEQAHGAKLQSMEWLWTNTLDSIYLLRTDAKRVLGCLNLYGQVRCRLHLHATAVMLDLTTVPLYESMTTLSVVW